VPYEAVAEIAADPAAVEVYAEGWQSWSAAGVLRADATSARPVSETHRVMGWRGDRPLPDTGIQAEGVLALAAPDGEARAWLSSAAGDVASLRIVPGPDRVVVTSDGPVDELRAPTLDAVLALVGERLACERVRALPPGWSSWSCYFRDVTAGDVRENLDAADRLDLPVEIVQIDDGWQLEIGDWLDVSPRFGSLDALAARIAGTGRTPGIWTAPFIVGDRSRIAAEHPDWLVGGAHAGENWGQRLLVLDVTHPGAASYLSSVYERLAELGFRFHKLDFLYAGALPGRRRHDCSGVEAYREGLRLIGDAAGGATLLGCGAPILPSVGLVDAMRVGPDVIGDEPAQETTPSIEKARAITEARTWMHGRLWVNDPDHLLARPEIPARESWAAYVAGYGGLVLSGDRLAGLDERGLELTRAALRPSVLR
jgi:alpha-galactosidase